MSGSTGADRVKSRQDFQQFLTSYRNIISKFPGFRGCTPSGSYNSDLSKNDFGDIDLITHIDSTQDKKTVKKEMVAFFDAMPDDVVVPFTSEKHAGKKTYNSGEIVTVRYHDKALGYSAQIDNMIALSQIEAGFKQQFLDMPAEMQGLVLGLVKVATLETRPGILFQKLGIKEPPPLQQSQEYEFNLSSVELQLRVNTYEPGTYKQISRDIIWRSTDYNDVQKLLYQYILNTSFDVLLDQVKRTIRNPRSANRIMGVFGSMITVKSGEVGTPKGDKKVAALAQIKNTLSEYKNITLLDKVKTALVESGEPGSTVVMAFGRFQPPTTGHGLLVQTVINLAKKTGGHPVIYVSKTMDPKKNPLPLNIKLQFLKKMFPAGNFVGTDDHIRTFMEAAIDLNRRYKNLIMVAGSDRAETYTKLLNQYNHKEFEYDSIKVMSSGYRDPDSDEVSGMSGTKMREAAIAGDFASFRAGLPRTLSNEDAKKLMEYVRAGSTVVPKVKAPMRAKELTEEVVDQNTWYFFDLSNTTGSFTPLQLKIMGLRSTQSGKWYYKAARDTSPMMLKITLDHLTKKLNAYPKAWSPVKPVTEAPYSGLIQDPEERARITDLKALAAIFGGNTRRARYLESKGLLKVSKKELALLHRMTDEEGNILPRIGPELTEDEPMSRPVKPFSQVKQYPLNALLTGQGSGEELKRSPEYRREKQVNKSRADMGNRQYSNGQDEGDWDR